MSEMRTTKNYFAHGGSELVIGGKLTFLPGATVEGMDGLMESLPTVELIEQKVLFVADSEATTVAALREDFNGLLTALREAGILAEKPETTGDTPTTPSE